VLEAISNLGKEGKLIPEGKKFPRSKPFVEKQLFESKRENLEEENEATFKKRSNELENLTEKEMLAPEHKNIQRLMRARHSQKPKETKT
jgi:hypothetical protein